MGSRAHWEAVLVALRRDIPEHAESSTGRGFGCGFGSLL